MSIDTTKAVNFPIEQFRRLEDQANKRGLSLIAYIAFIEQCRTSTLDAKAQVAAKFMFSKHGESLRKLAK